LVGASSQLSDQIGPADYCI